ncbi:MAG: hypothetical protein M1820_000905 [Bogoriella megaspora]|nr:MAG: hypothetical protein M1820_000905 [Bogoriella megaspora]
MLVPRAFSYSLLQEKESPRIIYEEKRRRASPVRAVTVIPKSNVGGPTSAPTKPVGIPRRGSEMSQSSLQPVQSNDHGEQQAANTATNEHDPNTLSPSVAALLAMTQIPPPKPNQFKRNRRSPVSRRISIDELIQDWRSDDISTSPSLGEGSPFSTLLEPPEESESDDANTIGTNERDQDLSTPRSVSSDSLPSLSADEKSLLSSSNPATPELSRYSRSFDKRAKSFSSIESESCLLDHPLLHLPTVDEDDAATPSGSPPRPSPLLTPRRPSPSSTLTSTFKSNLTASLLALKSAAKSFSNFTAPSIPSDDLLTRSIIFPQFASEMRPKPVQGVPPASFRRYLNPGVAASPQTSPWVVYHDDAVPPDFHTPHLDTDDASPMIMMQTYLPPKSRPRHSSSTPSRSSSSSSTSPDPNSEAGRAMALASTDPGEMQYAVRQREPRENSDFLRVVCLEMNMRRVGKLDAKKAGRARIWLPPRVGEGPYGVQQGVPRRWVGVTA